MIKEDTRLGGLNLVWGRCFVPPTACGEIFPRPLPHISPPSIRLDVDVNTRTEIGQTLEEV